MAVFNDDASRRRVTEVLRAVRPDVVITAAPSDYHCDHEAASALVRVSGLVHPAFRVAMEAMATVPSIP